MEDSMYEKLLERAKKEYRSLSGIARKLLSNGLSDPLISIYVHDECGNMIEYTGKLGFNKKEKK